jgi:hypothetical protein
MASNNVRWVKSLAGEHVTGPLVVPGNFAAGSSQAIKKGELLELTGNTNTEWVPLDSDFDMSAAAGSGGKVAIAFEEIKSGDLAGFYKIVVPRPDDVFEFTLLSTDTQNPALGTAVYFEDSESVSTTAGTNILGNVAGFAHYPYPQGHTSDDASITKGTTRRNVAGGKCQITIQESNSYYSALQTS